MECMLATALINSQDAGTSAWHVGEGNTSGYRNRLHESFFEPASGNSAHVARISQRLEDKLIEDATRL